MRFAVLAIALCVLTAATTRAEAPPPAPQLYWYTIPACPQQWEPPADPGEFWYRPPYFDGIVGSSEVVLSPPSFETEVASQFIVPAGGKKISTVRWWGHYLYDTGGGAPVSGFLIRFYNDAGGLPGTAIDTYVINNNANETPATIICPYVPAYEYHVDLCVDLPAGRYWCSIRAANHGFPPQWGRVYTLYCTNQSAFRSGYFGSPAWALTYPSIGCWEASLELDASSVTTQLVTIMTGQINGQPGTICGEDDCFQDTGLLRPCMTPLPHFTQATFDSACGSFGTKAYVLVNAAWAAKVTPWSDARWINWAPGPNCNSHNVSQSVLYCCQFSLDCLCPVSGSIDACWAVDDKLGDPPGFGLNPIGVYINGVPLGPAFSGGGFTTQTCASQGGLTMLHPGTNYLQVYQADVHCQYSGLKFGCTITVNGAPAVSGIQGTKFSDLNCDGQTNGGDLGLPGWTLQWQPSPNDPVGGTTTTNPGGGYSFSGLPVGQHILSEVTKPDFIQCSPLGGSIVLPNTPCAADTVNFHNCRCQVENYCYDLPACLSSWYDFDDTQPSNTAADIAAGVDATFTPSAAWGVDHCGNGAADLSVSSPTRYLTAASTPSVNDMGKRSFSIFGWIRLNTVGPDNVLVSKYVPSGGFLLGYALWVQNGGVPYFGMGDGTANTNYVHGMPGSLLPGNLYHVGVTVCRSGNLTTAQLWVNGVPDGAPGTVSGLGSVSNASPLYIGYDAASGGNGHPFDGYIEDLQIYGSCCLNAQHVADLYNHDECNYCRDLVYVPSVSTGYPGCDNPINLDICNFYRGSEMYTWTIAGIAGPGCASPATVYQPFSGNITIPPAPGANCVKVQTICVSNTANGLSGGSQYCYQISVRDDNLSSNPTNLTYCRKVSGSFSVPFCPNCTISSEYTMWQAAPGSVLPLRFLVKNSATARQAWQYRLSARSVKEDSSNQVVSLNGLPPGTPVYGTLDLAPNDSSAIPVKAMLTEFQPLNINEVVLSVLQDGRYVPVQAVGLQSVVDENASSVAEPPLPTTPAQPPAPLSAMPNPFVEKAGIRFGLASSQPAVVVGIFDVGGRLVRRLFAGPLGAGNHDFVWDGRDAEGRRSGSGIYFIRVQATGLLIRTRLVRLE